MIDRKKRIQLTTMMNTGSGIKVPIYSSFSGSIGVPDTPSLLDQSSTISRHTMRPIPEEGDLMIFLASSNNLLAQSGYTLPPGATLIADGMADGMSYVISYLIFPGGAVPSYYITNWNDVENNKSYGAALIIKGGSGIEGIEKTAINTDIGISFSNSTITQGKGRLAMVILMQDRQTGYIDNSVGYTMADHVISTAGTDFTMAVSLQDLKAEGSEDGSFELTTAVGLLHAVVGFYIKPVE